MIVYLGSCFASMLIAFVLTRRPGSLGRRKVALLLSAIPMIVVAAVRYEVGEDYVSYRTYFQLIQGNLLLPFKQVEPLYHWLNKLIVAMNGTYIWVFAVCAVIFYVLVYLWIAEESPMPVLSIFLLTGMGYVFVFFNAMRQMVGCALLMYAIRYIRRRQPIPFLICVALASGFHLTCAVFAAAYFLPRLKINIWTTLLLMILVIVLREVITNLARWLISYTPYKAYIQSEFDTGKTAYVTLAINAILLVFMSLFYKKNDEQYQLYYTMQLLAVWIALFSGRIVLMLRFLWMFGLASTVSLPLALKRLKHARDQYLLMLPIMGLYLLYTIYTVWFHNSNSVLPYQTILFR